MTIKGSSFDDGLLNELGAVKSGKDFTPSAGSAGGNDKSAHAQFEFSALFSSDRFSCVDGWYWDSGRAFKGPCGEWNGREPGCQSGGSSARGIVPTDAGGDARWRRQSDCLSFLPDLSQADESDKGTQKLG